ncbi:hypothetical protein CYFUS_008806 [Cystobacter fuscus]|uniref:HNH nuclease domain-containing protein n=1 Tax=Cystobacter fuscus TaxID=43 RepID=A0A250JJN1_9BACT|nr:HNH endonuclease [Cystobacter fuscus]ATB43326.1 hypothetical protein CYFUS_008806 [Cystobacter fuscus]
MRKLTRANLSPEAKSLLAKRTARVAAAKDPKAEAKKLWAQQRVKAFREIRMLLAKMASGRERCMYCEDSRGTDIDHFWPKADFPDRAFEWTNYLWACSHCNSNQKRDQFPRDSSGNPELINPTVEDPSHHLVLSPSTGKYQYLTTKGQKSCTVFGLNRGFLEEGRQDAWVALQTLLPKYAELSAQSQDKRAAEIRRVVTRHPFSAVLATLLHLASGPGSTLLSPECLKAVLSHPEIQTWIQ